MKIYAVGGYDLVGKNMTIVDFGKKAIVFDVGLNMEGYTKLTENQPQDKIKKLLTEKNLVKYDAIPNLTPFRHILNKVEVIVLTHAHLDHIGALPFLYKHFKNVVVLGTPYTIEILKSLFYDLNLKPSNLILKKIPPNSSIVINNMLIEFIYITHSTPQTIVAKVTHENETVMYANDFKLDPMPVLGGKVNYKALTDAKPDALILDSTRVELLGKTPSESLVEPMLREIIELPNLKNKGIIATTFSSHIARLFTLKKIGKRLKRKVYFLGRSMHKYIKAAEKIGLINFSDVEVVRFKSKIRRILKQAQKNPKDYFLVVTGHQGEPGSILVEMTTNWKFNFNDFYVIFSCSKIPTPTTEANRAFLESKLKEMHVPFFTDVHVSGHASREDLRSFINIINPNLVVPAHGDAAKRSKLASLAKEENFKVVLLDEGDVVEIEKQKK